MKVLRTEDGTSMRDKKFELKEIRKEFKMIEVIYDKQYCYIIIINTVIKFENNQ